jgi:hypothetical protein
MLDAKGRCCGRKPMVYKSHTSTSTGPHRYCPRCDRAYDLETGEQVRNWAWYQHDGKWYCSTSRASKLERDVAPVKVTEAARLLSSKVKHQRGGRKRSDAPRCPCGENTLKRAKARGFDCCKKLRSVEWIRNGRMLGDF